MLRFLLLLVISGLLPTACRRQICACSPSVYEFTFDFSLECEPINVSVGNGGVSDPTCLVTGFDNPDTTDLVPVAVSSVQIIEIGQDGGPAAVEQETGDFPDGFTISYTSVSANGAVLPLAFQIRALARNQGGEPIVIQISIPYTNDCGVFPVLEVNDSIGWFVFVSTTIIDDLALFLFTKINPAY